MWNNWLSFASIFSQQHLCQKLPKSVDVRWSYSVLHQRRFLDTVYKVCNSVLVIFNYHLHTLKNMLAAWKMCQYTNKKKQNKHITKKHRMRQSSIKPWLHQLTSVLMISTAINYWLMFTLLLLPHANYSVFYSMTVHCHLMPNSQWQCNKKCQVSSNR